MTIQVKRAGVSLLLILIAIVLFVLAAFGVDGKLGIEFVPLGLACFAGALVF